MTSHELYQHQIRTYNECLKIFRAKNADYAADYGADDTDPFRAFKFSEFAGICTVEQEIMSRVAEKLMRTSNLMFGEHEAQVKDEDIRQTLRDKIVYLAILLAYMDSKKRHGDCKNSDFS